VHYVAELLSAQASAVNRSAFLSDPQVNDFLHHWLGAQLYPQFTRVVPFFRLSLPELQEVARLTAQEFLVCPLRRRCGCPVLHTDAAVREMSEHFRSQLGGRALEGRHVAEAVRDLAAGLVSKLLQLCKLEDRCPQSITLHWKGDLQRMEAEVSY
jgi:hypothetical protein